ncbi:GDYXXLXY domain-containing protein [Paenibacillus tarimensis]
MRKGGKRLWLVTGAIVLQLLVLCGIAFSNTAVERYGNEIRLKTAPVDPRDLFYGDYVILNYDISTLPVSLWMDQALPEPGQRVYVRLRPSADDPLLYEAAAITPHRPKTGMEEAILRARVNYLWDGNIQLTYGFERYYVPEGTGRTLEERRENMQVAVKIAPWGQVKLSRLILPGEY